MIENNVNMQAAPVDKIELSEDERIFYTMFSFAYYPHKMALRGTPITPRQKIIGRCIALTYLFLLSFTTALAILDGVIK